MAQQHEPPAPDELPTRSETLEVRPAHAQDRAAVLAFCEQTWSDGDSIAGAWEAWLHDARGVLLVGVLAGKPVALCHLALLTDEEAWIEGICVDPAYRRRGFGRTMTSRALVAAHERGAVVARLFTSSENFASQGLLAAFGFMRVAELVRYQARAMREEPAHLLAGPRFYPADAEAFERIWAWLEQSNLLPLNGGLEELTWTARALSEPSLRAYLAAGQLWLLEEWETIQALAIAVPRTAERDGEPGTLEVRYLDGQADALGRMGVLLRRLADEHGLERVELWLPDLLILHDAMDGAGYTRTTPYAIWLYSRDLA